MRKIINRILAVTLMFFFAFSEWRGWGLTVNAADSSLTISGADTLSTLQKGNAWTCKGTVSSNYILKEVRGTIYESDGLTAKYQKSVYPNSTSYTIQNGEIDKALLFNLLQAGNYYYTIDATDMSGTRKTLVNNRFTVQGSGGSNLKITGANAVSSLKQGKSWTCQGIVDSNYILKEVRGTIYESDGITVKYRKSVYPNSKKYTIQNGEIDRALLFNKLSIGTYWYTIVASDTSDRTLTLVHNKFTVQGENNNAASALKIIGASTISALQQGKSWSCKGKVSSNYVLTEVRGTIYERDGITVKYRKSVYPNEKNYTIQNGEIDKALLFNKLPAGTYHYTIVASDASGAEKTLLNNKFIVQATSSKLKITGASTINTLKQGKSWSCKGKVNSNYILTEVSGTIYESDGITAIYRKSVYPNAKSYTIQNGEIDKELLFNRLSGGVYYYTVVAKDASGIEKILVNNRFTVQTITSTLKIAGASTISSLQQGKSWSCKGKVSSNYILMEVRGTIYESDGVTVKYRKSVYPNSKKYAIQNKEIDKALLFNKLQGGTYYYTIVAKDASGTEKTLVNNKFTVHSVAGKDFGPVVGKKTEKDILQAINIRNKGINITPQEGCVQYVKDKLNKMGYKLGGSTGNGIDWYKNFENGQNLVKGYSAECVPGKDSLKKLINSHEDETLYNVIVSFGTGKKGEYRNYGHVMLIDCIKDGKVYFSEMFTYRGGFESGKATVLTVDKFLQYYNKTYNGIKGVARLTKK